MKLRIDKRSVFAILQGEAVFSTAESQKYILGTDFMDERGCTSVIAYNRGKREGLLFHVDAIRSPAEVLQIICDKDAGEKQYTLTFVTPDLSAENMHLHRMIELSNDNSFKHQTLPQERIAIDLRSGSLLNLNMQPFYERGSATARMDQAMRDVMQFAADPFNARQQNPWDSRFIPLNLLI